MADEQYTLIVTDTQRAIWPAGYTELPFAFLKQFWPAVPASLNWQDVACAIEGVTSADDFSALCSIERALSDWEWEQEHPKQVSIEDLLS